MGEKLDAHSLFHLTIVNDGQLPMKMSVDLDINLLGMMVQNVGFLVVEEPNSVLDKKPSYKTSRHHRLGYATDCLSLIC